MFGIRKKILCMLFAGLFVPGVCAAKTTNPFFGDNNENQVAFYFGYGVNQGFLIPPPTQFVPFILLHAQYSQPTTFFRLPARQSLNIMQTIGSGEKYGWHWDKYSIPITTLSMDVALLAGCNWYFGPGIAMGLQAQQNERIGSKLLFGFKLTGGVHITNNIAAELFVQHYSDANTSPENYSYAFYGAGLTYSF